jgi:hypothetical protein
LGGEEAERHCPENQYNLMWLTKTELEQIDLFPEQLKNVLIAYMGGMAL